MLIGIAPLMIARRCYLGRRWKITQSQELFWMAKGNSKIDEDLPTLEENPQRRDNCQGCTS